MMQNPTAMPAGFDQGYADILARHFNLVFSSAIGYGPGHPSTRKNIADFHTHLGAALDMVPGVSIFNDRESIYFEDFCVDTRLNLVRFVQLFKKRGMQSITFERGLLLDETRGLIDILADTQRPWNAESIREELINRRISHIRINYISYKKVTADEAIISREQASGDAERDLFIGKKDETGIHESILRDRALNKLGKIFSLRDIIEAPASVAGNIMTIIVDNDEAAKHLVVRQLREINRQIHDSRDGEIPVSSEEIMEAVYKLKLQLREGLQVQKEIGRLLREEDPVINELDRLTYRTIVQLVKEEYGNGTLSVARLAHIIRRMVPDVKDLKRLLPQLKDGLVAQGMPMADFMELIKELNQELQNEQLADLLADGAEEIGVSVTDIFEGIRENPGEAARLIVLATEIRQGAGADPERLSALLSDYIEDVSSRMAIDSPEAAGKEGGKVLRNMIYRLEKQLLDKIKSQGVPPAVMNKVEQRLASRFKKTIDKLKSDWMVGMIAGRGEVTTSYLTQILDTIVDKELDLDGIRDPLREVLLERGYSLDRIQDFYDKMARRLSKKKRAGALPRGVMNSENTVFFLKRQISACNRYHHPFSIVLISIITARTRHALMPITPEVERELFPVIYTTLCRILRDLDIIGSFGSPEHTIPFVILPMTDRQGAHIAAGRIKEQLRAARYPVGDSEITLEFAISVSQFDPEQTPDLKSYLAGAKELHKKEENAQRSA